jgi:hypothetical protein
VAFGLAWGWGLGLLGCLIFLFGQGVVAFGKNVMSWRTSFKNLRWMR